jgi:hypothetical protein
VKPTTFQRQPITPAVKTTYVVAAATRLQRAARAGGPEGLDLVRRYWPDLADAIEHLDRTLELPVREDEVL